MKELYYKQMIEILMRKPKGMRLSAIVKNIYNQNAELFSSGDLYDEIYRSTFRFLYRECKKKKSMFYHVPDKWGFYAVRRRQAKQLLLKFSQTDATNNRQPI